MKSSSNNDHLNDHFQPLESLFDFATPAEMRRSILKLYFQWMCENKDFPEDVRHQAENIWLLVDWLEEKDEQWKKKYV